MIKKYLLPTIGGGLDSCYTQ